MSRLLKAEFNSIYRKPKLYVLLGILVVAFGLGILIDHFVKGEPSWGYNMVNLFYPFLAIILTSDITHKEYKFHTMKNLIGSGFSRKQIYFGKLIVTLGSALAFLLVSEILKIVYALINHQFASKIYPMVEVIDGIRRLSMFAVIFIICMLIVSDGLSLFAAFMYGVVLGPVLSLGSLLVGLSQKTVDRIGAATLVSSDAYIKINVDPKTAKILSSEVIPSGLIWCALGVAVAVGLLILGYQSFKRKEFK